MKKTNVLMIFGLAAFLASTPALAQSVKVGPNGTKVKAGGVEVETSDDGTKVHTGNTDVEVGGHGAHVRTDQKPETKPEHHPMHKRPKRGAVICTGTDDIVVKNKTISGPIGVDMRGSCTIVLEDCDIVASKVGINIAGSGDVKLVNCTVRAPIGIRSDGAGGVVLERSQVLGKKLAMEIKAAGDVTAKNSTIKGRVKVTAAGEFKNEGGNTLSQ